MLVSSWHNCSAVCFVFEQRFTHSFTQVLLRTMMTDYWLLIKNIFESSDYMHDNFLLVIESLRQLQTIVNHYYCWRLWQCLPTDTALFLCFMIHRTWSTRRPGHELSPWNSRGCYLFLNWTVSQSFSWRPTTHFRPYPHQTCGGNPLEKNSDASATQNQLSHDVTSIVCDVVVPSFLQGEIVHLTAICPSRYYALCGRQGSSLCVSPNDRPPNIYIPYQGWKCFWSLVIHVFFDIILAPTLWFGEKRDRQPRNASRNCSSTVYTIYYST